MGEIWAHWHRVLLGAGALELTAVAVVVWRVRRGLRSGVPAGRAWRHASAEVFAVAGTIPWVWMILTPVAGHRAVRLVPLVDLFDVADGGSAIVQIGGNLAVFAALGLCLPVRFALGRTTTGVLVRVAGVAAACSVAVETLQFILPINRVSSVDDVLLNTAGAVLAAACSRRWWEGGGPNPLTQPGQDVEIVG